MSCCHTFIHRKTLTMILQLCVMKCHTHKSMLTAFLRLICSISHVGLHDQCFIIANSLQCHSTPHHTLQPNTKGNGLPAPTSQTGKVGTTHTIVKYFFGGDGRAAGAFVRAKIEACCALPRMLNNPSRSYKKAKTDVHLQLPLVLATKL